MRTNENHRLSVQYIVENGTYPTLRGELESVLGARFSVLLLLPYFDVIRMTIIDPMHNLFLGTAKRMIYIWMKKNLITKQACAVIQAIVDEFIVPADVGRIPHKIGSLFSSFTADQWKHWTVVFSVFALTGILPEVHLNCWKKFVVACSLMCSKTISKSKVKLMDQKLLEFGEMCEQLYDQKFITPNMHLHGHLCECMNDYGPIHGFWLFSFERYNGLLGMYNTNRKNIETQIMERFLQTTFAKDLDVPNLGGIDNSDMTNIFSMLKNKNKSSLRGTLQTTTESDFLKYFLMSTKYFNTTTGSWHDISAYKFGKTVPKYLTDVEFSYLSKMFQVLYGTEQEVSCFQSVMTTKFLRLFSTTFGSADSRSKRSAYIQAYWSKSDDNPDSIISCDVLRPGKIVDFFFVTVVVNGESKKHLLAYVQWYRASKDYDKYGIPVEVWSQDFEDLGVLSYLPVQRIHGKYVFVEKILNNKRVIIVCPLCRN